MSNLKNVIILIYRSEDVHVELIDSRVEGDLNKVIWSEPERIVFALCNIISNIGGKPEAIPYISIQEKNTARIGIRITVFFDPENIDLEAIQLVVTNFLNAISKKDHLSGELFSQQISAYDEVIKKEAFDFLTKNGDKHIKHPLDVCYGGELVKMEGKFAATPNQDQLQDDPPEVHVGLVDGLVKHSRTVHLKLTNTKIIVAYFNHNNFTELHRLLQSEEPHKFVLQKKYDANGKKDMYLIAINKHVDELLNFTT